MQAAIKTVAHALDRVVRRLPISGRMAALARWNSSTHPAKINNGRLCSRTGTWDCAFSARCSAGTAMSPFGVDFARRYLAKRDQCRRQQHRGDDEHGARREEMTAGAHRGGGQPVADRCKARIAAQAFADRRVSDKAKADGGNGGPQHATGGRMQNRGGQHRRKDWKGRVGQRADADGDDCEAGNKPLGSGGVDDRAARHLPEQGHDAADRQDQADIDLRPFLRGQINRDERPETGLNVGHAEHEPVETAKTAARRCGRRIVMCRRLRPRVLIDRLRTAGRGLDSGEW